MPFRFIHTADWQIGKVFRFAPDDVMGLLQQARLDAVANIGDLATAHSVRHILVAGDVYDLENLSPVSRNQPLERMRTYSDIRWHLLPGNHDPQRPHGLWDTLADRLPDNVVAHTRPIPHLIDHDSEHAAILPAPLYHRRTLDDPTEWMTRAHTPDGAIRVGLAHGAVHNFSSDEEQHANPIDPERPQSARLDYLALGDWHGQLQINDRCWYAGTHETDRFATRNGGRALLVEIDHAGAKPNLTPLHTGRYDWRQQQTTLHNTDDIDHLEHDLRQLPDPRHTLVDLTVDGALSLEDSQYFDERIVDGVAAALCFLRIHRDQLYPRPTPEDLDRIDPGGTVRAAADSLRLRADNPADPHADLAADALLRLYTEYRKLEDAPH